MTKDNASSSASEVQNLLEKGAQSLMLGKYEKALRYFNQACTLEPNNVACQHWEMRAEWLISYTEDHPWKKWAKSREHGRESLATSAKGMGCYFPKFDRVRLLHLSYSLFLAELGEFEDSELEAQWLLRNGYKDAAKQVRVKIQSCKEKS